MLDSPTQPRDPIVQHVVAWSSGLRLPVFIVVVAGLCYLPGLGVETGVTGQDEYLVSLRTPLEMLEQGHVLTPWRDGAARFEKPPLLYWSMLASYAVFGVSLFAARIWGVLAAIGTAWVTGLAGERLQPGRGVGLLAALLVLTSGGVVVQGRMAMLDLPLAFFVTLAVYLFMRYWQGGGWPLLIAAAGSVGASFLLKGPVGPALAAIAMLVFAVLYRAQGGEHRRWWHWPVAIAAVLVVCLPWPLAMIARWGDTFLGTVKHELTTARFRGDRTGPDAVIAGMLVLVVPWCFLYLAALVAAIRRFIGERDRLALWLALWNLMLCLPFLLLRLKFERYLLVAVPAAILLVTMVPLRSALAERIARGSGITLYVLVASTFGFFGLWFGVTPPPAVAAMAVVCGLLLWLGWGPRRPTTLLRLAAVAAIGNLLLFGFVYPSIGVQRVPEELVRLDASSAPLQYFRNANPGLLSMTLGRSVQRVDGEQEFAALGDSHLIVEEGKRKQQFVEYATAAGGWPQQPVAQVRTFYSRKAWLRFARKGATAEDWRRAFETRSLDGLKTTFEVYRWPPPAASPVAASASPTVELSAATESPD